VLSGTEYMSFMGEKQNNRAVVAECSMLPSDKFPMDSLCMRVLNNFKTVF
jgi:hypothetical protein